MKIAFYAPLKSPHHPVPSGDRQMARLLMRALSLAGHEVRLVSEFRSYSAEPARLEVLAQEAAAERERIAAQWAGEGLPDLWLTYHVYYKAPDFLGPPMCRSHGLPYVTVEASYSSRRDGQGFAASQRHVLDAVRQAAVNICMTRRDHDGLREALPQVRAQRLAPFIDAGDFFALEPQPEPGRLITVAMMRPGDKMDSYRALAAALPFIRSPFTLDVIGDGPCRGDVEALLNRAAPGRVFFHGQLERADVARQLSRAALYVWPGCGEAFGLSYLEAQAAGVPVVALDVAGVPEVVRPGETGVLVPAGDAKGYAQAVDELIRDEARRAALASGARAFIRAGRTVEAAARRLDELLEQAKGEADGA